MGPLHGYTVIELAGLGPCPMAGMLLADMGARVVRIEREGDALSLENFVDVSMRGKQSLTLDLRQRSGVEVVLRLIETADALIEGYRPGVAERLGLGPADCRAKNTRLVYGRITGWGQDGPLARVASHDINYIALTGALHAIGPGDRKPTVPLNLIADMGGGGFLLAFGVVCALLEARGSGVGQVVDAAMIDGTALMLWLQFGLLAAGGWNCDRRESNLLDGGAYFYDTYETADGKFVAIGALEPKFYENLLDLMGLDRSRFADRGDRRRWPELRRELAEIFRSRTRDEWCALLEQADTCFSPVLSMREAPAHHHLHERKTYVEVDGVTQPAPAPRFSRTRTKVRDAPAARGADGDRVLLGAGYSKEDIRRLRDEGILQGA